MADFAKRSPTHNPSPQGGGVLKYMSNVSVQIEKQRYVPLLPPSPLWGGIEGGGSLKHKCGDCNG